MMIMILLFVRRIRQLLFGFRKFDNENVSRSFTIL